MSAVIIFFLFIFIGCGFLFHYKLRKNKSSLANLKQYGDIEWELMYIDAFVQWRILRNIFKGKSEVETELKTLLFISLFSFFMVFCSMFLFLSKEN